MEDKDRPSLDAFRKIVDKYQDVPDSIDLISPESSEEDTHSKIKRFLPVDLSRAWAHIRKLRDRLIIAHFVEGAAIQPYLPVLEVLSDSSRVGSGGSDSSDIDFENIVPLALGHLKQSTAYNQSSLKELQLYYPRPWKYAESIKFLASLGYKYTTYDGLIVFDEEQRMRMLKKISHGIDRAGPIRVAAVIFNMLALDFDSSMDRYLGGKRVSLKGEADEVKTFPVHFLLELAARRLPFSKRPDKSANESELKSLFGFTRHFARLYDTRAETIWENLFKTHATISDYISELSLYDRFFTVRQLRPKDIESMVRTLFSWVTAEHESKLGWTIERALSLFKKSGLPHFDHLGPIKINLFNEKDSVLGLGDDEFSRIFKMLVQQQPGEGGLPEKDTIDYLSSKPFFMDASGHTWAVDRHVVGDAFVTTLALALLKVEKATFSKIGDSAEDWLKEAMRQRGLKISGGSYEENGRIIGECDVVLETDRTIFFLEVKCKSFTMKARTGRDINIILDVFQSLFDASSQALGHEIFLRKREELLLIDKSWNEYVIRHQDREIHKIAVTAQDFGSFQDRSVIGEFFENFLNAKVAAFNPADHKAVDEINETSKNITAQFLELGKLTGIDDRQYDECWFLSIPQLFVLLDRCKSNDDFEKELFRLRRMSFSSFDAYTEIASARRLDD